MGAVTISSTFGMSPLEARERAEAMARSARWREVLRMALLEERVVDKVERLACSDWSCW